MKLILRHQAIAEEVMAKLRDNVEVVGLLLKVANLFHLLIYLCLTGRVEQQGASGMK